VFAFAVVFALTLGFLSVATSPVEAKGRCLCPQVYAPVECDRGKIYSNQCVADCRNAKNCVPIGAI
jgi:hypothetical protein